MRHLLAPLLALCVALPSRAEIPAELTYQLSTKTTSSGVECTLASTSVSRHPSFGFTLGIRRDWVPILGQIVTDDPTIRNVGTINIAIGGVASWFYFVRSPPKRTSFTVGQISMARTSSLAMLRDVAAAARDGKTLEIVAGTHRRQLSPVGLAEALEGFLRCVAQRVT